MSSGRIGAAVAFALGIAYACVVPLGEAPDEGAHLHYLERTALGDGLPLFTPRAEPLSYEAHQPPLDYALVGAAARVAGVLPVGYSFVPDPELDFERPGSRAYLASATGPEAARRFRHVRLLRLLWLWPTTLLLLATARAVARRDERLSSAASAAVVLSPQLLFVSATVNNDGGVTFFAVAVFLLLVKLVSSETPSAAVAALAGTCTALAILSKGTGLALLAPAGVAAVWTWRRARRPALVAALLLPAALGAATLLALNQLRFGSTGFAFPPVPGHDAGTALRRLFEEPEWFATLATSFWARFGWFNLPLPAPAYLLFLPAGVAALAGLGAAVRTTGADAAAGDARPVRLAVVLLASNLAIVVAHMVLVAWQPQGRLLLPSLGAFCALVVAGLRRLGGGGDERARTAGLRSGLPALMIALGLAANGLALLRILRAYD